MAVQWDGSVIDGVTDRASVMTHTKPHQCEGFTLIELMVVMAVVAVLLVVGVAYGPRYVARRQMEQTCLAMVQDMQKTQADAIFKRTSRTVQFDTTANSYQYQDASGTYLTPVKLGGGVVIQSAAFGGTNPTWVTFTPFGAPSEGTGKVVVTGPSGLTVWVNVSGVLGRVSMEWR